MQIDDTDRVNCTHVDLSEEISKASKIDTNS